MRFVPNPLFEAQLLRSTFVKETLEGLVKEGAQRYEDSVPVAEGDLRDSVFGDVKLTAGGFQGRIGATDWKAGLIEFGTARRRPDGSLRRAVEGLGVKIEPRRRR